MALWDGIERSLVAWQDAGTPDIDAIRLRVTADSHLYWPDRSPSLRWEHRLTRAAALWGMDIRKPYFDLIASGAKTIEVRVGYSRIRRITAGDTLRITCGNESLTTRVTAVQEYESFKAMLDAEDPGGRLSRSSPQSRRRPTPEPRDTAAFASVRSGANRHDNGVRQGRPIHTKGPAICEYAGHGP
ncbi:ASCH domain-containing protein [Streptomyces sp. NBC_01435]|uniref:ASCH domain-containing protein n=1 Tax=Streptomyces sp. NBC_01435 TaxID=2903865 RepID=UPI002E30E8D5|nr:ASCH domain-containing protein [Streptomyces sp. NBC_01435]